MRCVVTGALGHVGSQLVRDIPALINVDRVVMLDNLSTQRYVSLFNLPSGARYFFYERDVMDDNLADVLRDGDIVVHLAAETDATRSFSERERFFQVNRDGALNVGRACLVRGCSMVFFSTTSVYGTQREVVDENAGPEDLKPQSPYAEAKLAAEEGLGALVAQEGLRCAILRCGTICGVSPGMRFHTAINKFCWQAAMGQRLTVWRTALDQKRPYLALSDAIAAVAFVAKENLFDGRVYNVLTENMTVRNIVDVIRTQVPRVSIETVDAEIMNQLSYEVSSERIAGRGFCAKGSIAGEIGRTISILSKACGG